MGRWETLNSWNAVYSQVIKEGFVLTQGHLSLHFDDNPFGNARPNFPSFQLLKVHRGYPVQVSDGGKVGIRPVGDKRLPGEILRDKNPCVYDSVSFFLAPYDIQLPKNYLGGVFTHLDGFVDSDGKRDKASLVYIDKRGLNIDGVNVITLSLVMPSQIHTHFADWLCNANRVFAYDDKAKFGEGWKQIGRFDLSNNIGGVKYTIAQELEKRFDTRLLPERKM